MRLAGGGWEAALLPELGGAIGALRHAGVDVLRPTPTGAVDPLATACFPLVPYANRIAQGRFTFEGREIALPRNHGTHPHSLHGVGWQRPWTVSATDAESARLTLAHDTSDAWPWRFSAEQRIGLDAAGFAIELTLHNEDRRPMPAGLGFHPYFPASAATRLQARVEGAWLSDDTQLPTDRVAPDHFGDWASGDAVMRSTLVDHAHDGWDGTLRIDEGGRTIRMKTTGTRGLHLYMPPDEAFFCAEPVTHLPDAVNRPGNGMAVLAPGETLTIGMRLFVD